MSDNPSSIKPPLTPPKAGDPIRAAQIASLTRRLMDIERQSLPGKPESWTPPRFAVITGPGTYLTGTRPGYYLASEVYWYGRTNRWTVQPGGVSYGTGSVPEIWEVSEYNAVPIDTVVQVFQLEQQGPVPGGESPGTAGVQYAFDFGGKERYMPFEVEMRPGYPDQVVVGRRRSTFANDFDRIFYRETHGDVGWGLRGAAITKNQPEYLQIAPSPFTNGWVYYHVDILAGTATLSFATSSATATAIGSVELFNVPLAYLKFDLVNERIERISQYQFGNIVITWWRDPASITYCSINHQSSYLKLVNDQTITELDATGKPYLVYGFKNSGNVRGWAEMEDVLGSSSIFDLGGVTNIRVS